MIALLALLVLGVILALVCLFLWTNMPVVVLYGGAYTDKWDYTDVVLCCYKRWPWASVVVLCAQDIVGDDWWAEPAPSPGDVQFYACRDAYTMAYNWTTAVKRHNLYQALMAGLASVSRWRRLYVIGFSNGCVPAQDLAFHGKAFGIWMASGLPADHQDWAMLKNVRKKIATISTCESYWGGCNRMQYFLRRYGGFDIFLRDYKHAREDTVVDFIPTVLANL